VVFITKNKLNIGHLSTAYHTNFILMANKKLEKALKNNINWTLFGTGPAMVEAFNSDELDIGYMGLPPAIVGIDREVSIKCIAGGHVEGTIIIGKKEFNSLIEFKDNLFGVLSQFKGKSIGVTSKGSIHEVILSYYLNKYNLHDLINVKYYAQAEFIALDMKKGNLAAGVGTPALAVFSSTIDDSQIIVPPNKLWENNPSYGIFSSENFMKKNPEIIIKFLNHHKEASTLLRTTPLLAAKKIVKSFEIVSEDYVKSVLKISPKYCIALSEGFISATMEFTSSLYKLGYIKRNLTLEDIFNFTFVNKVHPEKDHYNPSKS
jgi:NitT/TauT family transport system substrate-binding protein